MNKFIKGGLKAPATRSHRLGVSSIADIMLEAKISSIVKYLVRHRDLGIESGMIEGN